MSSHSYGKRLAKIESLTNFLARKKPTRDVSRWSADEILTAVEEAVDPADEALVEQILRHVDELAAIPWQNQSSGEKYLDDKGKEQPTPHHFTYLIFGLEIGSWHLPKRIPREVLQGFGRLWGAVLFRCEDCLTGLGNARLYETCPVCHGAKLSVKKLSGPPWDAAWQYTPLPRR